MTVPRAESGEELKRVQKRLLRLQTQGVQQQIANAVAFAKALADPRRLELLAAIGDAEVCVCNLVASIDLSQPAISHHLSILSRAGLLARRKEGRYTHYRCILDHVEQLAAIVHSLVR